MKKGERMIVDSVNGNTDESIQEVVKIFDSLPKNVREQAEQELKETPGTREKAVKHLIELLSKEPGLKFPEDAKFLIKFLRNAKFNIDKAFEKIKSYYKVQAQYPEILRYTPSQLLPFLRDNVAQRLPLRSSDGCMMYFIRINMWNPRLFSMDDIVNMAVMCAHHGLEDSQNQISGYVLLISAKNLYFQQYRQLTLSLVTKVITFIMKLPIRLKAIHVVECPYICTMLYKMFYPVLPDKIRKRLFIHYGKDLKSSLHQYISPELLTKELDGTIEYDSEAYISELMKWEPVWEERCKFGYQKK